MCPGFHPAVPSIHHHHHHHTYLFPALNAEVKINALTICGKIGISKISIDRTKGDAAAPALPLEYASMSFGSLYGTLMPTERLPSTKKIVNRQKMERYALGRTARGFSAYKPEEKNHKKWPLLSIVPRQDLFSFSLHMVDFSPRQQSWRHTRVPQPQKRLETNNKEIREIDRDLLRDTWW